MAKNEMNRLLKHSWIYTVGSVLNRIGAFILLPLYTNHLQVAEYGTLELFYSTKMIVASILSIGLAHATLRFYFDYDNPEEKNEVVGTALIATTVIALPFIALLSLWSRPIAGMVFGSSDYAPMLNLIYVILLVELSEEVGQAYIRAKEYSIVYVIVNLLQLVLQVGFNYYAVAVLHKGIMGVLTGNLISMLAGWTVVTTIAVRECGLHFSLGKLKRILNYSYPFLFSSIFSVIISNADRFILKSYGSMENVGLYSLAQKFGMLLQVLFLEPFNRSFGAFRFSIMKQDNVKKILSDILNYRVLGLLTLGMGIIVFSKPVIHIMTAREYWEAHKLLPFIIFAGSIGGLTYVFQTGILYEKKTHYMFYITLLTGGVSLLGNFILIPRFDALGAAVSQIFTGVTIAYATYYISHRLYPIQFDHQRIFKMYGAAGACTALFLLLPSVSLPATIGFGILTMTIFITLMRFLGCIEKDHLDKISELTRERVAMIKAMFQGREKLP